jgi:hypothetical protein
VELEGLAPKGFAAEGVEAKNSPAILERLPRVVGDGWVDRRRRFETLSRLVLSLNGVCHEHHRHNEEDPGDDRMDLH